jgi:hypothetical protein
VREKIEYRFRVLNTIIFTLYSYSKTLEYNFRVSTAGSLNETWYSVLLVVTSSRSMYVASSAGVISECQGHADVIFRGVRGHQHHARLRPGPRLDALKKFEIFLLSLHHINLWIHA